MGLNNPESVKGLHYFLLRAVPVNQYGRKTILHLAELLGVTRPAITKWVKKQCITPERALQLVEISKIVGYTKFGEPVQGPPRISRADLDPYVYNV